MNEKLKVISLAPTQTEIIAALGWVDNLAGVSENCDFPESVRGIARYGSWYSPDLRRVVQAEPDLVCTFGKHQEDMAEALREEGLHVFHSDPPSVADSLETMEKLSAILGCPEAGGRLVAGLKARLANVARKIEEIDPVNRPTVFRIMNWEPLVSAGPGSFQHDVIERAGGINLLADGRLPYMVCEPTEIRRRNPRVIFTCEGFITGALRSDPLWMQVDAVKHHRLYVFDCGLTCRSGPRIVDMVEALTEALHFGASSPV